ncbi:MULTISPECIES: DUF6194 family protein [Streptomyces]|uniref:DUF6194 domain-containing protein n=1 Tax=Streptomyces venezuelae TaxID=54571 RepID=A0A5P2BJ83_STRVZ|nr:MULTISPECIES: DUF6194 family protein [Streptomyces]NEA01767.1 hypothetical protein [Streptomyces sp. SID10116]MYY82182.1 hypothetical protein [Streptomyces sp. SID335]MYZ12633.1 hypothetical protein [Streptomyces sp. SID337]NDZ90745.1 hypothetical protein [Streptomyces sp. SID10115]NEB46675.1 hypothetical protein [Streptomyces sp. SID339]
MEQIIATVRNLDGALVLVPEPGSDSPELAWGDAFFYYAPDGRPPENVQPYGTVVTKNYPDDTASDLDLPGRWRVNVRVDRATFRDLTGEEPHGITRPRDHATADRVLPHPVYGALGWVCVVNPGERTADTVVRLLRDAHEAARARFARRHGPAHSARSTSLSTARRRRV